VRQRLLAGVGASAAISLAGYRARALSRGGALAAVGVGSAIITGTGWRGATILGGYFISSSMLSRIARESDIGAKGSQRDTRQVLANGGVAGLSALLAGRVSERRALDILAGSLAAAAADTWATEIGSTSARRPRTLVGRREVEPGTSGGVTRRGLAGAAAGAAFVGLCLAGTRRPRDPRASVTCFGAGLAGSLMDSVLGELVQERRYCPSCQRPTEARVHRCGTRTIRTGGVRGVDNDVVNLACTLTGAGIAALVSR
jgi:uncharacterized protein (TIGR00297 family)